MVAKLEAWQLWMTNAAALVQSGFYKRLTVKPRGTCYMVLGEYPDGTPGAPLAKYGTERKANDVARMVNMGLHA